MGIIDRVAFRSHGSSCCDIINFQSINNNEVIVKKMIYANNIEGIFSLQSNLYCISLDKTYPKCAEKQIDYINLPKETNVAKSIIFPQCVKLYARNKKDDLLSARIMLVVGFGISNKETITKVELLADKLKAKIAGSRPVIMNAWLPMDKLIGVSGNIVQPEICIVLGASGAPAFYVGIEKSKYIIAVNKDETAPIMKKSDLILVEDVKSVINELLKK